MKNSLLTLLLIVFVLPVFSQEESDDNKPVRPPFETSILIDNHTTVSPYKGGFEFEIHHRFGTVFKWHYRYLWYLCSIKYQAWFELWYYRQVDGWFWVN
jgi:hypothetical protein